MPMNCEVCGKEVEETTAVKIESSIMKACKKCASLGEIIERKKPASTYKTSTRANTYAKTLPYAEKEDLLILVDGYGRIIQKAREKLNLTQEKLAAMLNEKASVVSRIESGHMHPSEKLARKLEKMLKIKIVEER